MNEEELVGYADFYADLIKDSNDINELRAISFSILYEYIQEIRERNNLNLDPDSSQYDMEETLKDLSRNWSLKNRIRGLFDN